MAGPEASGNAQPAEHQSDTSPQRAAESTLPELYARSPNGQFVKIDVELASDNSDAGPGRMLVVSQTETVESSHRGPMPAPETLAAYEQLVPGFAQRLADDHLADKSMARCLAERQVANEAAGVARGQWIGLFLMLVCLGGAIIMGVLDHLVLAALFLSPSLVLAISRYYAHNYEEEPDEEKPAT